MRTRSNRSAPIDASDEELEAAHTMPQKNMSQNTTHGPPAKKAKIDPVAPIDIDTTDSSKLDFWGTIPLDILFEILEYLHSTDLLTLSRTTKGLRATLLDSYTTPIWRRRRQANNAPNPPKDMSEVQWASLIFSSSCMMCHAKKVKDPQLLFRRRVCSRCRKNNRLSRSTATDVFPILNNIPGLGLIFTFSLVRTFKDDEVYYWKPDIEYVRQVLASFDPKMYKETTLNTTRNALTKFLRTRQKFVKQKRNDDAEAKALYDLWRVTEAKSAASLRREGRMQHFLDIINRFKQLGYEEEDMREDIELYVRAEVNQGRRLGELTDRAWARIRRELEPYILKTKQDRLEIRDKTIRNTRRVIFEGLYSDYHLTVNPSQWSYMPTAAALYRLQPLCDIIESDRASLITAESFAPYMENIGQLISIYKDNLKRDILFSIAGNSHQSPLLPSVYTMDVSRQLELATVAIVCRSCNHYCFGWDEISSHYCSPEAHLPHNFEFHRKVSGGAMKVILSAGLCLESTTAAHMDALDLRFNCSDCTPTHKYNRKLKNYGGAAYKWRDIAVHISIQCQSGVGMTAPDVLSTASTELVRAKELASNLEHGPGSKWACTHCVEHITVQIPYHDVVQHIQEIHNITAPHDSVDLIKVRRLPFMGAVEYEVPKRSIARKTR